MWLVDRVSTLNAIGWQFKLILAHDGSGQGAAIVAAVAKRQCDQKMSATDSSAPNNNSTVDNSASKLALDNAFEDNVFEDEKGLKSEKLDNALSIGSTVECYY